MGSSRDSPAEEVLRFEIRYIGFFLLMCTKIDMSLLLSNFDPITFIESFSQVGSEVPKVNVPPRKRFPLFENC